MKPIVGVFGSAGLMQNKELIAKAEKIGETIALMKCRLLTGATTGLPFDAVRGAKRKNGFVIGISPASSKFEHVETFHKPLEDHDVVIFTGAGFQGRDIINVKSCDAAIFINGGIGTLHEFTVAYTDDKIIGVLEDSGGISDKIHEIIEVLYKKSNSVVVFDSDPEKLVKKVIMEIRTDTLP
ncbi:MAG: hypothetical protein KKF44_05600 [Nanoarchaeota archaeon]|nr:hypothetical protein [Nanoarchaeota archaeon]